MSCLYALILKDCIFSFRLPVPASHYNIHSYAIILLVLLSGIKSIAWTKKRYLQRISYLEFQICQIWDSPFTLPRYILEVTLSSVSSKEVEGVLIYLTSESFVFLGLRQRYQIPNTPCKYHYYGSLFCCSKFIPEDLQVDTPVIES